MKKVIWCLLMSVFMNCVYAQSTIVSHDFNSSADGWTTSGGWVRDNSSFTGNTTNHWHITPFNNYSANQSVYVTSGTLNLTSYSNLSLSFSLRHQTEVDFDGLRVEYSDDGGGSWNVLGSVGSGTNWYNDTDVDAIGFGADGWSDNNGAWATSSISLPTALENNANVQIRFFFASDGFVEDDGVAFDDFTITGTFTTTVLSHDFNSSADGWSSSGGWTRDNSSFTGNTTNHWHITPFNNYSANQTVYTTSGTLDLSGFASMSLSISIRYQTEATFDGMRVEYSDDGGGLHGTAWAMLETVPTGTTIRMWMPLPI